MCEAERIRQDTEVLDAEIKIKQEKENVRLQALREHELEVARQNALEKMADRWSASERIRLFADSCEKQLMSKVTDASALSQWVVWARAHADRIDPIQNGLVEQTIPTRGNESGPNDPESKDQGPTK